MYNVNDIFKAGTYNNKKEKYETFEYKKEIECSCGFVEEFCEELLDNKNVISFLYENGILSEKCDNIDYMRGYLSALLEMGVMLDSDRIAVRK